MSLASERRSALERAFPGVTCSRIAFDIHTFAPDDSYGNGYPGHCKYNISACVKGPAEVLIAHELVSKEDIEELPPSGKTYGFRRLPDGTYQKSMHWSDYYDYPNQKFEPCGRDMAARIGIAYVDAEALRVAPQSREIRGRVVSWKSTGTVICVDWDAIRSQVLRRAS